MVAFSKLFKDGIERGLCCNEVVHSGSCRINVLLNTYKFVISNMKYFAPVIFLPLLVHIRSINKELLLSTLKYYIGAVVSGASTGWLIVLMICFLRYIFGKFGYYTFLFWPSAIGSFALWTVPSPRVHRLFETSVFQCTIESFIMQQKTLLTKSIAHTTLLPTLIFMCCSGLIMHAKREKTYMGFWLLEPAPCIARSSNQSLENSTNTESELSTESDRNSQESIKSSCSHSNQTCTRYAMQGIRNYMIIGLTLDVIKVLLAKVTTERSGFMVMLIAKMKTFKPRSCALLTSYIAIYRLLHCYFNRNYGGDSILNHTVAAILSGSCYVFYPKLTLLCYALVMAIQISWQRFKLHLITNERYGVTFEWINKLPCTKILYPVALGYLVNTYCTRPHYVSGLGETIINAVTNNYAKTINQYVVQIEKQLECSLPVPSV